MKAIITQTLGKIKGYVESFRLEILVSLIIVFVAVSSYYLGRATERIGMSHEDIYIEDKGEVKGMSTESGGEVVATKTGKRWYMPWCATVAKLPESAKRHFASVAAAEAIGLTPAKNCAGMK